MSTTTALSNDPTVQVPYESVRGLARRIWRGGAGALGIDATDLANECYLRILDRQPAMGQSEGQRLAYCATLMRRLVVDESRRRQGICGGSAAASHIEEACARNPGSVLLHIQQLEAAMEDLRRHSRRLHAVAELRGLCGCGCETTAQLLGISERTTTRDWAVAKAWLKSKMLA